MSLINYNFESQYLMNNHEISIILPDNTRDIAPNKFYGSGEKYKVLWLLHGTYGDHSDWIRKSNIELYAAERNLVVVMPSALNSNYVNWNDFGIGYKMWDYLFEELMPLVYNWFPVSDKKEDNYIAGLSMGGAGVLQYICGCPQLFSAAAVLSYAPYKMNQSIKDSPFGEKRTEHLIRNAGGIEQYIDSVENVWDKIHNLSISGVLPKTYFAIGTKDFLYEYYVKFKEYARDTGLDLMFEEYEGYGHEWRFWDKMIEKTLDFFGIENINAGNAF